MMTDSGNFTIIVDDRDSGKRFDVMVASRLSDCSRSYASILIRDGKIQIQGEIKKPGYRVKTGDLIQGGIPLPEPVLFKPEPIPIDILFEDDDLIVVNKQPGLVVHPAPGNSAGTLVNGLLYHCPTLGGIGGKLRPGIVHRLDKNTSGALVVAKHDIAHRHLSLQFKSRRVEKKYLAVVQGEMDLESGTISLPIGRHPIERKQMSTLSRKGREAMTLWKVRERFHEVTLLELDLKTGRTHQIRVHCAAIHHPIVGDPVYGSRRRRKNLLKKNAASGIFTTACRQMLHAWRLCFIHPETEKKMSFEAPLPSDMAELIVSLRI